LRADLPESALEAQDHVPKAEHIKLIKSCLIRDDLHMRTQCCSKGHHLTPALKEFQQTRAECVLHWHAENRHENILFMDEKIFTIEEHYNNQNKKIYAQMSLEVYSKGAGRPPSFLCHGLVRGVPSGGDTSSFLEERGEAGVVVFEEDVLQGAVKPLNMTLFSCQDWVFQQDSAPAHKAKTTRLRSGCGETFWPSSAPRIGPR